MSGVISIIGGGEIECTACEKPKDGVAVEIDGGEVQFCWACLKRELRVRTAATRRPMENSHLTPTKNGGGDP